MTYRAKCEGRRLQQLTRYWIPFWDKTVTATLPLDASHHYDFTSCAIFVEGRIVDVVDLVGE